MEKRKFTEVFSEQVKTVGLGKALSWNIYWESNRPLRWLRYKLDTKRDLRICGVPLEGGDLSQFRESHGATNSLSTPYGALEVVLGSAQFTEDDAIIDIGCGHGRVLAYLVDSGFPGHIAGVELNPDVASFTRNWLKRYPEIELIEGDAFKQDLSRFNVFYLWKPMLSDIFKRFVVKLEKEAVRPITMYYVMDFETASFFQNRPGWHEVSRMEVHRVHGLPVFSRPLCCTVWKYVPGER